MVNRKQVLDANYRFYQAIAQSYDKADSRRGSNQQYSWIVKILENLKLKLQKTFSANESFSFADAGTGSGLMIKVSEGIFPKRFAIDLSPAMLDLIKDPSVVKIESDLAQINLENESVHFVSAFATLHHLYDPKDFLNEAYRILKPGGILYSDHDIEKYFVQRFHIPLKIYRFFFDHWISYKKANPELKFEDYKLSEYHGDSGIDSLSMKKALHKIGFKNVSIEYHWQGMGPFAIIQKLLPARIINKKANSPILRIIAEK